MAGGAAYSHPVFNGSFSVGASGTADQPSQYRGVWLWRPSTDDLTPPVIGPTVSGTLGSNGWYVSDVAVTWDVQDPDSPVSSQTGCDAATRHDRHGRDHLHVRGDVIGRHGDACRPSSSATRRRPW